MFKTRLLSGILLVIIALVTVISGGPVLFGTVLAISLIGMSELYKVLDVHNKLPGCVGYLGATAYYILIYCGWTEWIVCASIIFLVALMMVYVFSYPKYNAEQVMLTFFGLFYVAVMLSYVYQTRMLEQGAFLVWLVFICSWGCDTCAYCVGVLIGKHKMAASFKSEEIYRRCSRRCSRSSTFGRCICCGSQSFCGSRSISASLCDYRSGRRTHFYGR